MKKHESKPCVVHWFKNGAEVDIPYAHWKLGQCYLYGRGVESNLKTAIYHFNTRLVENVLLAPER